MPQEKQFFLTFDGAPHPPQTDALLQKLAHYGILATFFMEGKRVEEEPECARRVQAAGHAIGNHSYSHPDFNTLSLAACDEEIQKAQAALLHHLNFTATLLRPPFGKIQPDVLQHFESQGFTTVLWDYSIKDWEGPNAEDIATRVLSQLTQDQAIIVMHDRVEWNPNVLDIIVPEIQRRGYRFCAKAPT